MKSKITEKMNAFNPTTHNDLIATEKTKRAGKKSILFSMSIGLLLVAGLTMILNRNNELENKEHHERKEVVANIEKVATAYKTKNTEKTQPNREFSSKELAGMGIGLLEVNQASDSLWNSQWRGRLVIKEREKSVEIRFREVTAEECKWLLPALIDEFKEVRVGYVDVKQYSEGLCFIPKTYSITI